MNISIELAEVNLNVRGIINKLRDHRGLWTYAAMEWHRLYSPYVPMDTGMLTDEVRISPKKIVHVTPYAQYQYNGDSHNFRHDKHPKASAKWDLAAEPTQRPKLEKAVQGYIDSGRVRLDD
jgi:hypothetical protein